METTIVKKQEIPETLYFENQIVIRVPLLLHWSNPLLRNLSTIRFSQKIDKYVYVGLRKSDSWKLSKVDVNSSNIDYSYSHLIHYIKSISSIFPDNCFEISVYSDIGPGLGFGFTNSVLIGISYYLFQKGLLSQVTNHILLGNTKEVFFSQITSFFSKIGKQITGHTIRSIFSQGKGLCITFHKSSDVHECFINDSENLDFDFIVVNFGLTYFSNYFDGIKKNYEITNNSLKTLFSSLSKGFDIDINSEQIVHSLMGNFIKFSVDKKNYRNGSSFDFIKDYSSRVLKLSEYFEGSSLLISTIFSELSALKCFKHEDFAILPLTSIQDGGTFLIVAKSEISKGTLDLFLNNSSNTFSKLSCLFKSWEFGFTEDTVSVQQDLEDNILHSVHPKNATKIITYHGVQFLQDYQDIHGNFENFLCFNSVEKKVFYQKRKLTHKDLLTQSATVELLGMLLKSKNRKISNKDLPASSYSKNKNELIGKVILPLKQLFKNLGLGKIDFSITGTLNFFSIELLLSDHDFIFIEPFFNN